MDKYIGLLLDDRYEILDVIGVGGMAVVYRARCRRLNRYVAVKILREEFAKDSDFRRRFEAESRTGAMLSHPNIVSVYDVSQYEGIDYIVMELIDGMTLKEYMTQREQLSWREALHFSTLIAKALDHAHSRGIIHRDIKPQNIMILRDGSAKVADFGIARISATQNTVTQEALGSVHYISPEQAKGANVDSRCDIYSLGVVMYEMLTGRLPYDGETPVAVAVAHINSKPVMPREIDPSIPVGIEQIAMKAMTADLNKRYMSAEKMLEDLEEFRKNPEIDFNQTVSSLPHPPAAVPQPVPVSEPEEKTPAPLQPSGRIKTNTSKQNAKSTKKSGSTGPVRTATGAIRTETQTEDKKVNKLTVLAGILCILVFVAGIVYFLWSFFLSDFMAQAEQVTVPSFVGMKYTDILENEEYNSNFYFVRDEDEYSNTVEAGYVIRQNPTAFKSVRPGTQVSLTVSKGIRFDVMPNLVNSSQQVATVKLSTLAVDVRLDIQTLYSADYVKDYIVKQSPDSGAVLYSGDTVTIWVSLGPEIDYFPMPDLYGLNQDEAVKLIQDSGLLLGEIKSFENELPEGTVYEQSIRAGDDVTAGTSISLQVSSGPVEEEEPPEETPEETPPPEDIPSEPPEVPIIAPEQRIIKITLPEETEDRTTVRVMVKLDKIEVFNEIVDCSEGVVYCTVYGVGQKALDVYFDNDLAWSDFVDFNE